MRAAAVEEAGSGSGSGGGGDVGLGIGSGGASTGVGYCALCFCCSALDRGCGEFATLSAPAWPPKENGGSEGDVAFFSWPSDEAIDGLS